MHIFVADLDEYGAAVCEQVSGDGESVAQVREVRVDAISPSVSECFDLLGFSGDVVCVAVSDVSAGSRPLEVRVESDAVRGIDVYALDFVSHAFAFCERCHDLQAVAEYHAVRPVGVVLVELGLGVFVWESVEVGEQIGLGRVVGVVVVRLL